MNNVPASFYEVRETKFIVSKRTKKLWAVILDLLMEFDRVCKKNGIKYQLTGGSLLGAVRHDGIIPWDDDIDIRMSRVEYNKLDSIAQREFVHPYFWQTNETDPGSCRGHAQLRNSNTTGILRSEMVGGRPAFSFNQGVFIDVFPFDNVPDDEEECNAYVAEVRQLKNQISRRRWEEYAIRRSPSRSFCFRCVISRIKNVFKCAINRLLKRDSKELCKRLDKAVQRYSNVKTKKVAPTSFIPGFKETIDARLVVETITHKFEFLDMPISKYYEENLTILYGNWNEYVVGASAHGGIFIDLEKPYTAYLK